MKRLIPILAALVIFGGCEQDPLKDASSAVRGGHLPDVGKIEPQKPLDKEALQVDGPELVNARVNFPVEVKLAGRVLVPDVPFKVIVENMDKFPGATFDETTGVFKWTPSKEFMAGQLAVQETMKVVLQTEPGIKNYPVAVEKKSISVVVVNSYERPLVNSVTTAAVVAGEKAQLNFVMEDQDAINENDLAVIVTDCAPASNPYNRKSSLAGLVSVDRTTLAAGAKPGQYTGNLAIDLRRVDYLAADEYCFAVQAVSKFGVVSDLYEKNVSVKAKVFETRSTLSGEQEVMVGNILRLNFSFYDPSGNGYVTLWSTGDLNAKLPGSSISCNARYGPYLDCSAIINAMTAQPGKYSADIQVKNTISPSFLIKTHTLNITVK